MTESKATKPIKHRLPKSKTVKELYATAFRCGWDGCKQPLYRMNDSGEFILNSTIAHICARSEGGPRWDPQMPEDENRSGSNLLPLCQAHSFEVDQEPLQPVELLRSWKVAQIVEYEQIQKSWTLTDDEVKEVVHASFRPHDYGVGFAAATSVIAVAKAVGVIAETARHERRLPRNAASEWRAMRSRVERSSLGAWDAETGESIRIEPSRAETAEYQAQLLAALSHAASTLRPLATELIGELHAVRSAAVHLVPWCEWIELAAAKVVAASGRWPGGSAADDDEVFQDALTELLRASAALSATWHGKPSERPPVTQPQGSEPDETEAESRLRTHSEILNAARPWSRVDWRPYDQAIWSGVFEAARFAIRFPHVLSCLSIELGATAGLAAGVARNADDATFESLIEDAAIEKLLAVAVNLARELMLIAKETGRTKLEKHARDKVVALLGGADWASADIWVENRFHMRRLLAWSASVTTDAAVRDQVAAALAADPQLLEPIVLAISTQGERLDPEDRSPMLGIHSQIRDLPTWFPAREVASEIRTQYPKLLPADRAAKLGGDDEFLVLARQLLHVTASSADGAGAPRAVEGRTADAGKK